MKRFLLSLFAILALSGQTTQVIELEKSDAEMIRSRYIAMKAAEEAFMQADKWVKKKYSAEAKTENEVEGMEYSADFRFLLKPTVNGNILMGATSRRGWLSHYYVGTPAR
jgi:hypothetical protein